MNYRCSPRHFLALAAAVIVLQRVNGQSPLEAPFTRITDEPVTSDFGEWSTPAWGDMDNDGWLDLFISNHAPGGSHGLFRNNRDGTFTKVTTGAVATASTGEAFGAAWADYDNDGWLDLVVSGYAPSAPNAVFR